MKFGSKPTTKRSVRLKHAPPTWLRNLNPSPNRYVARCLQPYFPQNPKRKGLQDVNIHAVWPAASFCRIVRDAKWLKYFTRMQRMVTHSFRRIPNQEKTDAIFKPKFCLPSPTGLYALDIKLDFIAHDVASFFLQADLSCSNLDCSYVERLMTMERLPNICVGPNLIKKHLLLSAWTASDKSIKEQQLQTENGKVVNMRASCLRSFALATYVYAPGFGLSRLSPFTHCLDRR